MVSGPHHAGPTEGTGTRKVDVCELTSKPWPHLALPQLLVTFVPPQWRSAATNLSRPWPFDLAGAAGDRWRRS